MKIRRWLRVRKGRIPRNIGKNKKTIKKENSITKQTQEQERKRKECRQRKAKRGQTCVAVVIIFLIAKLRKLRQRRVK